MIPFLQLEKVKVLNFQQWDGNHMYSQNHLLKITSVNEVSERFSAGGWSRTTGHILCAWCQLLEVKCPLQTECAWDV